jgi:hypothetical protein
MIWTVSNAAPVQSADWPIHITAQDLRGHARQTLLTAPHGLFGMPLCKSMRRYAR